MLTAFVPSLRTVCRSLVCFVAIVASLNIVESDAEAQMVRTKFKDKVHVVQPKPVLQKGRFEFAPRFGASVNDAVYQSFKVGANANYHIAESFYVGLGFDWFNFGEALGGLTNTYELVANQAGASADTAVVNYAAFLEVAFVPFFGKFSLFNSAVVYYDFAVTAGGGWIDAESVEIPSPSGKPGGTISLNSRLFISDWVALNFGIRDLLFLQNLNGASDAFTNLVTVEGGFSFFLPTTFEYSEKILKSVE